MKNTKVLEMINNGEIEALKELLKEEIYTDSMAGKADAKKRYAAMKRYQKYIPAYQKMMQKPCKVVVDGKEYISFLDGYSISLTTENAGKIDVYDNANGDYFDIEKMFSSQYDYDVDTLDFNAILAEAKSRGYKYKKSEIMDGNDFMYVFHYKNAYYKVGIMDQAFSIINDGNPAEVHYIGEKAPLEIITSVGKCIILPFLKQYCEGMKEKIVINAEVKAV